MNSLAFSNNEIAQAVIKRRFIEGSDGTGLVHRSPAVSAGERLLFLTFDFN